MKRFVARFIILMAVVAGITVIAFWLTKREKFILSEEIASSTADDCVTEFVYETADGLEDISYSKENHSTAAHANEILGRVIQRVPKIIERSSALNTRGQASGERVVALRSDDKYIVLWTEGATFHQIIGDSLLNVLEFEKSKVYRRH